MRDLDWSDVVADGERMQQEMADLEHLGFIVADDRDEHEPCQRLTPGCCVNHNRCDHDCETW